MDCPSEESMVRMKLDETEGILQLDFDLSARTLEVYHNGKSTAITSALSQLNLGAKSLSSEEVSDFVKKEDISQRKVLWIVLAINFCFFLVEIVFGFVSGSMGLVADSLDMLADAFVYGLSLMAVGAAVSRKKKIARLAGYFQISLAILGFAEVLRRYFGFSALPDFSTMIIVSAMALAANAICLYLLQKTKSKEAHMQASMIFTSNDVVINLGVIIAGVLVHYLQSPIPDLLIGALVFLIVLRGALRILRLGR